MICWEITKKEQKVRVQYLALQTKKNTYRLLSLKFK